MLIKSILQRQCCENPFIIVLISIQKYQKTQTTVEHLKYWNKKCNQLVYIQSELNN